MQHFYKGPPSIPLDSGSSASSISERALDRRQLLALLPQVGAALTDGLLLGFAEGVVVGSADGFADMDGLKVGTDEG